MYTCIYVHVYTYTRSTPQWVLVLEVSHVLGDTYIPAEDAVALLSEQSYYAPSGTPSTKGV